MNALVASVEASEAFVERLKAQSQQDLENIDNYARSAQLYQRIGQHLGDAVRAGAATAVSMRATLEQGRQLVSRTNLALDASNAQSARIAGFLQLR